METFTDPFSSWLRFSAAVDLQNPLGKFQDAIRGRVTTIPLIGVIRTGQAVVAVEGNLTVRQVNV
jgi:hypothetical protein